MRNLYLQGGEELMAFLDTLPEKLARNAVRGGMYAGAKVTAEKVRANAATLRTPEIKHNGVVTQASKPLSGLVKVGTRTYQGGDIIARVYFKGFAASVAIWAEYGTLGHYISVRDDVRPVANTRRGPRRWSIRTINKSARRGSLMIGSSFVGASVWHPGSRAHPTMRSALDATAAAAVEAIAGYVRSRLSKEGLNAPDVLVIGEDVEDE